MSTEFCNPEDAEVLFRSLHKPGRSTRHDVLLKAAGSPKRKDPWDEARFNAALLELLVSERVGVWEDFDGTRVYWPKSDPRQRVDTRPRPVPEPRNEAEARLLRQIDWETSETGCWGVPRVVETWTETVGPDFEVVFYESKARKSFERFMNDGTPIPDGFAVHHLCLNVDTCVRPDHLSLNSRVFGREGRSTGDLTAMTRRVKAVQGDRIERKVNSLLKKWIEDDEWLAENGPALFTADTLAWLLDQDEMGFDRHNTVLGLSGVRKTLTRRARKKVMDDEKARRKAAEASGEVKARRLAAEARRAALVARDRDGQESERR